MKSYTSYVIWTDVLLPVSDGYITYSCTTSEPEYFPVFRITTEQSTRALVPVEGVPQFASENTTRKGVRVKYFWRLVEEERKQERKGVQKCT